MTFSLRKAQVQPTITWPVESGRDAPPPTAPSSTTPSSPNSWQSSHLSHNSVSTTATSHSCELNVDDYFAQFRSDVDISDQCPDTGTIAEAGAIPIYDCEGNAKPFKSLYSGETAIGEQQLIIFVRHFFCGACQAYLQALSKSITLQTYFTLPIPTSITVIGLGSHKMISSYRNITGTSFPIYADPTRKLYKALGMGWTLRPGPKCDYMKGINELQWMKGQMKQLREEDKALRLKGGNVLWVGGEFMFSEGQVVWCKRMKNYRGHSEIEVIRRLLGVED